MKPKWIVVLCVAALCLGCDSGTSAPPPVSDAGVSVPVDEDNDGVAAADDCDDGNAQLGARADDADCDGHATAQDCDDQNPASTTRSTDGDCDGAVTADDCADDDPESTLRAEDGDCDGYPTAQDCDDTNAQIYPGAPEDWNDGIDSDCDGNEDSVCGDGRVGNIETCDDGNEVAGDGCSQSCAIEPQCTQGCTDDAQCTGPGERCVGLPRRVEGATGQCEVTNVSPPGTEEPCSLENPCGDGLACLGAYSWGEGGWCVAGWFAKDFYSHDAQEIPEGRAPYSSTIVACGLASVPVDIVVRLHLDHPRPEDLLVQLEDPNGQIGTVLDHEPWTPGPIVARVGSGDDTVNGNWTLHVRDTVTGETGVLTAWSLYLLSNWD